MNAPRFLGTVGRIPGLGSTVRWCARHYEENSVVTIRHGWAAGLRWRRHHRYVNGYWLGHYETPVQAALARQLKPDAVFFDLGAHAGFFTLVGAHLVGEGGRCVAVDPWPENHQSIAEQIELNGLSQCFLLDAAIDRQEGQAHFSCGPARAAGHLGRSVAGEKEIIVRTVTVDQLNERFGPVDVIKLDVEGAEIRVLQGAVETLRQARPVWLIELHGPECERAVKEFLDEVGYACFGLGGRPLSAAANWPAHILARPQPPESP